MRQFCTYKQSTVLSKLLKASPCRYLVSTCGSFLEPSRVNAYLIQKVISLCRYRLPRFFKDLTFKIFPASRDDSPTNFINVNTMGVITLQLVHTTFFVLGYHLLKVDRDVAQRGGVMYYNFVFSIRTVFHKRPL